MSKFNSVYIVRLADTGEIKIGWSSTLRARLRTLAARHCGAHLLAAMPGGIQTERWIQGRFSAESLGREQFRPSRRLLAFAAVVGIDDRAMEALKPKHGQHGGVRPGAGRPRKEIHADLCECKQCMRKRGLA